MYLLKLALRPWRLAPMSQLFSALSVGFLLLLVGFLFWMQFGLKSVLVRLQREQVVTAYLDSALEEKDEEKLVDTLKMTLGAHPQSEVKLVTSQQFLQQLKDQYPDLVRELEDLGQEMKHVIPRYVSVSGLLPQTTLEKVKSISGIESAESSKDRYHHIVGAFSVLRWVARILMGGVCLALLTGLIHLTRMNAYLHRDALRLLRYWGAGAMILVSPGLISGAFVGFLGGAISSAAWIGLGDWFLLHVRSLSSILKGMPAAHSHFAFFLLLGGGLLGIIAGVLGSLSASHLGDERGVSS